MKKHALIILSLSAGLLSGCATSRQVQKMIEENNEHYDAQISRIKADSELTKSQLAEVRTQWTNTVATIQQIKLNTLVLEEARQSLLNYSRQHEAVLNRFIKSMEDIAPDQSRSAPATTNATPTPSSPAPVVPMTTPEPVY